MTGLVGSVSSRIQAYGHRSSIHSFSLRVMDSPACPCGYDFENSNHYLLQFPWFTKPEI